MENVTTNAWHRETGSPFERTQVLDHRVHPQGLDVDRARFLEAGSLEPRAGVAHMISVFRGTAQLEVAGEARPLAIEPGVHVYLPPSHAARLRCSSGAEVVLVSAPTPEQSRGRSLILRDEAFVCACATEENSLRWILTPQYLSRRIFLHHDEALLSKSGEPVSWFHTTMFDVTGLPPNADGESVFKMAYNTRTEINVCYDAEGDCRVRMARHPYGREPLAWGPWLALTSEANYHLFESLDHPDVEWLEDEEGRRCLRNKHEVHISRGHVTLFCLFDPSPTGIERHRPGEYSDYEALAHVTGRPEYAAHRREIGTFDEMVAELSLAKARGELEGRLSSPSWARFREGKAAQLAIEARLRGALVAEGLGRERLLDRWMLAR